MNESFQSKFSRVTSKQANLTIKTKIGYIPIALKHPASIKRLVSIQMFALVPSRVDVMQMQQATCRPSPLIPSHLLARWKQCLPSIHPHPERRKGKLLIFFRGLDILKIDCKVLIASSVCVRGIGFLDSFRGLAQHSLTHIAIDR